MVLVSTGLAGAEIVTEAPVSPAAPGRVSMVPVISTLLPEDWAFKVPPPVKILVALIDELLLRDTAPVEVILDTFNVPLAPGPVADKLTAPADEIVPS